MLTPLLNIFAYRWSLKACEEMEGITNCPHTGKMNPFKNTPVFIVGMNEVGQTLARAFQAHDIPYVAVVRDRQRFMEATALGYVVAYGQPEDLRFWGTLGITAAKALCIAAPHYQSSKDLAPIVRKLYPNLKRYVAVKDSAEGVMFAALGIKPFHYGQYPAGLEMACHVLEELGIEKAQIDAWAEGEQSVFSTTGIAVQPMGSVPPTATIIDISDLDTLTILQEPPSQQ